MTIPLSNITVPDIKFTQLIPAPYLIDTTLPQIVVPKINNSGNTTVDTFVIPEGTLIPLSKITSYYEYQDIGSDPNLRDKMIKYYYQHFADKWLITDYRDLLKYLIVKGGKVHLISKLSEYKSQSESDKDRRMKVEYILENYLNKSFLKRMLNKYVEKKKSAWANLYEQKDSVKEFIYKKVKESIKENINH